MTSVLAAVAEQGHTGGLTGLVLDIVEAGGAWGVGAMSFAEVVFPPIPSEIVLPLAGYQVTQGRLGVVGVMAATVVGSVLGSVLLYCIARTIGLDRAARIASKVPLMDAADVYRSGEWFHRHQAAAVFTGRFVPGIRSLVSLPAGAAKMNVLAFTALTTAGSGLWNCFLVGLGMALGTQYRVVETYGRYLDYAFYAAFLALVTWAVVRRVRRNRVAADTGPPDPGTSTAPG